MLKEEDIGTSVYFIPVPLHHYYREAFSFKRSNFPVAEEVYERVVFLSQYPKMSDTNVKNVIEIVRRITKADEKGK